MTKYMPAVSHDEAASLVQAGYGHDTEADAAKHLAEIQKPPTDSFYAQKYRVYEVTVHPRITKITMKGGRRKASQDATTGPASTSEGTSGKNT